MPFPLHTALVEFSTSHLECLQTQIHFLKRAGATVELFLSLNARERASFLKGADRIHYLDVQHGLRGRWKTVTALRRAIRDLGVRAVVFNTAEGNHVRDFCLLAPRKVLYAGLLHHTNKLGRSFTQYLISRRIHRYYVLMDYLLTSLPKDSGNRFASVSPIFHATTPPDDPVKAPGEFWVCIPGELEFRRRDYRGLADAIRKTPPDPAIRLILLGSANTKDGVRFNEMLTEAGVTSQFLLFREYVSQDVFTGYLARCDVILPLTHPGIGLYEDYRHHQVSGSFLEALCYSRPMLLDRSWADVQGFGEISLFYDLDDLIPTLNWLVRDDGPLAQVRDRFARTHAFSFDVQQKRYLDLLNTSPV